MLSTFGLLIDFAVTLLAALAVYAAWLANRNPGRGHPLAKLSGAWFGSIMLQVFLGAATIWTGKSADIATAHVALGAVSLMTGTMLAILAWRCLVSAANAGQCAPPAPNGEDRTERALASSISE